MKIHMYCLKILIVHAYIIAIVEGQEMRVMTCQMLNWFNHAWMWKEKLHIKID